MNLFKKPLFFLRNSEGFKDNLHLKVSTPLNAKKLELPCHQDFFKRLQPKEDTISKVSSKGFLGIVLSLLLTDCSFVGIHDQSFDCPALDGMKCTSTTDVNKSVDREISQKVETIGFETCNKCSKREETAPLSIKSNDMQCQQPSKNSSHSSSLRLWDASLKRFVPYLQEHERDEEVIS